MITHILQKLSEKKDLTYEEAYHIIVSIKNDELRDDQMIGFQVAMLMKGPTLTEITAIAQAMRDHCIKVKPKVNEELMDTCGTGGGLNTFNISTAVAILSAAAGIPVAKHGSRTITGLSGSADVLEALGVQINQSTTGIEKLIEQVGIAYLYAPLFHPIMNKTFSMEENLGIKTIFFTVIGPLINPTNATRHVMGVSKPELLDMVTQVAIALGYQRAVFVHGEGGLDEISLLGKTRINELINGEIKSYEITPEEFGLSRCNLTRIATGTPEANATMIKDVFSGKDKGPRRQAVMFNAAAAFMVGGKVETIKDGILVAKDMIDSGMAQKKLNQFVEASHEYAAMFPRIN